MAAMDERISWRATLITALLNAVDRGERLSKATLLQHIADNDVLEWMNEAFSPPVLVLRTFDELAQLSLRSSLEEHAKLDQGRTVHGVKHDGLLLIAAWLSQDILHLSRDAETRAEAWV